MAFFNQRLAFVVFIWLYWMIKTAVYVSCQFSLYVFIIDYFQGNILLNSTLLSTFKSQLHTVTSTTEKR